jgi:hypothetical protein
LALAGKVICWAVSWSVTWCWPETPTPIMIGPAMSRAKPASAVSQRTAARAVGNMGFPP